MSDVFFAVWLFQAFSPAIFMMHLAIHPVKHLSKVCGALSQSSRNSEHSRTEHRHGSLGIYVLEEEAMSETEAKPKYQIGSVRERLELATIRGDSEAGRLP